MKITKDIRYIGVNDREIDLFEGQYVVPEGMAYNSYVILDEKIAVMDSVDARFGAAWLDNLRAQIGDRAPDYLIVQKPPLQNSPDIIHPILTVKHTAITTQRYKSLYPKEYF